MATNSNNAATTSGTGTTGRRFGRKSGPAAIAQNEMKAPGMKMVMWRAKSGERWGVARARVQEKFSRLGASMTYGVFSVTHPIHPIRRRAAKDAENHKKAMAGDVRVQREAAAHSVAAGKRANAHQSRVNTLDQAVH